MFSFDVASFLDCDLPNGIVVGLLVLGGWSLFKGEPERTHVEVVPKVVQGLYFTIHLHLHDLIMIALDKILERFLPALLDIL